jgi:hypothetical protein
MKRDSRTGQWLMLFALATTSVFACSDADDGSPVDAAGSGGEAQGGEGGSSGAGAAAQRCAQHSSCDVWGANLDCPATLDDVVDTCDLDVEIERFKASCGGTYVVASNGVQESQWTFDADGKLIGATSWGDVGDCDYWGTRCAPVGSGQTVCNGSGGAGGSGAGGEPAQQVAGGVGGSAGGAGGSGGG